MNGIRWWRFGLELEPLMHLRGSHITLVQKVVSLSEKGQNSSSRLVAWLELCSEGVSFCVHTSGIGRMMIEVLDCLRKMLWVGFLLELIRTSLLALTMVLQ